MIMMKANPQLLIVLAIYFNGCSYAQEQQKMSYDIRINYSEKRRVYTRSSFKDKEVSKKLEDDVHLFFETGFLKDRITLIINNEVVINRNISETVYYVNSNYEVQADGTSGEIRFDSENNRVMINVASSYGLHGLAHELTHGIQFENGRLDFLASSGGPGYLYDVTDEVQAFRRQYAVKPGSLGDRVRSFSDITPQFVSQLNKLYQGLPQFSLTTKSTLMQLEIGYKSAGKNVNFSGHPQNFNVRYNQVNYSSTIYKK
ncbi:MAG: hypothetical protein ABIK73_09320 [candidate division WOR-3 bacterium]